jgi:hypothetical protein
MPNFILPYEPDDVTHFETEKRQRKTKDWLTRQGQPTVKSPPIAPDVVPNQVEGGADDHRR